MPRRLNFSPADGRAKLGKTAVEQLLTLALLIVAKKLLSYGHISCILSIGKWRKIANSFIVKMRIDMARVIRDEDGETNNNFSMLKSRDCTFVGFLIFKRNKY